MAEVMMMLMISANKYFVCSWMRTRGKLGIRRTLAQTNFLGRPVAGRCKSVFIILLFSPFFGYLSALKGVCVCVRVCICVSAVHCFTSGLWGSVAFGGWKTSSVG